MKRPSSSAAAIPPLPSPSSSSQPLFLLLLHPRPPRPSRHPHLLLPVQSRPHRPSTSTPTPTRCSCSSDASFNSWADLPAVDDGPLGLPFLYITQQSLAAARILLLIPVSTSQPATRRPSASRWSRPGAASGTVDSTPSSTAPPTTLSAMELSKHKIRVNAVCHVLHLGDKFPLSVGEEKAEKATGEEMPWAWLDQDTRTSRCTGRHLRE
ncbi:hypothetical protein ZWY2020_002159 [Hordeum vulgare]|nr:hypothetical protein ZWY2020_002159 [Hordeum vulgare]